jgi:CRP/FNR family cyclic AMP-dependent transcriptional regulator
MTEDTEATAGTGMTAAEGNTLFPFLSDAERGVLLGFLEYREYAAKAVVVRDGQPSEYLAFLAQGKLAVKKQTTYPDKYILVAILEPGALVGDYASGQGPRHTGTVAALEPSALWVLSRERLDQLLGEYPDLGRKLLVRLIQTLSLRLGQSYDRLAWLL